MGRPLGGSQSGKVGELASKRERIVFLLEHWVDFFETMEKSDPAGAGFGDDGVALMPSMFRHPSVAELRRAVDRVGEVMPRRKAHMLAFFGAEWRTTDRVVRRTTKKRKTHVATVRVRERVVPGWVDHGKVEAAVAAVVHEFRGEVFIPSELVDVKDLAA